MREDSARGRVKPDDDATGTTDGDDEAAASDRLGDVAPVRDQELEPMGAKTHARDGEAADDPPGRPDHDHETQAYAHREGRGAKRSRRQQHELRVVAGLRPPGRRGDDDERRVSARGHRHPPGANADPRAPAGKDPWPTTQIEAVAGPDHLDDDRPGAGARQCHDLARGAGKGDVRRRCDQRYRRPRPPRARSEGREEAGGRRETGDHCAISVYVSVPE